MGATLLLPALNVSVVAFARMFADSRAITGRDRDEPIRLPWLEKTIDDLRGQKSVFSPTSSASINIENQ